VYTPCFSDSRTILLLFVICSLSFVFRYPALSFLSLKIQASSEIILFETLSTDHQTQTPLTLPVSLSRNRSIALYVSSLQDDHLSIKRYGMKRSTSCTFAVLLHPTTTHLASIFSNYFPSLSPQKQVNMRIYRITVFWIWRHIRPSTHAPLNSVVNQNGGVSTYFDEP